MTTNAGQADSGAQRSLEQKSAHTRVRPHSTAPVRLEGLGNISVGHSAEFCEEADLQTAAT